MAKLRTLSLAVVYVLMVGACSAVPKVAHEMQVPPQSPPETPMLDAEGPRVSSVDPAQADTMLILTVTEQTHRSWTGGQRIQPMRMEMTGSEAGTRLEDLPPDYRRFLDELYDAYGLRRVADWPLNSIAARCLVFETTGSRSRDDIVAALSRDPRVRKAQPLNLFATLADDYNDPYVELQHGFRSMQVAPTHRWSTGNEISVAVVDTGVDIDHPDLREQVALARNFVDRDQAAFVSDLHGTAVAAVIAAAANNATGIVGVAPRARVLALKSCWQNRSDVPGAICSSFTLAKSIDFAILQDVDIINLSLAGPPDPLLELLVRGALDRGIQVVGALDGNNPENFPAYITGVIGVADSSATVTHRNVDARAPGHKIFSARANGDYDFFSGSSISAAHISGLLALIRERRPHLHPDQVQSLINHASLRRRGTGTSQVDACRALAAAIDVPESQCL